MEPLRVWRARRLMSIRDLAQAACVVTETISRIEHGRGLVRPVTMRKIAAALDVKPSEITEFAAAIQRRGAGGEDRPEHRDASA